jgi:hypothetical protein
MLINLRKAIKASATVLIAFSLSACTTIELIHVPVGCEGQPKVSLNLTDEEAEVITDEMETKIIRFATTLRERINTQCEINYQHDEIHR